MGSRVAWIDPLGLWAETADTGDNSFAIPAGSSICAGALEGAIEKGLDQAASRLEAVLSIRQGWRGGDPANVSLTVSQLPRAESDLLSALETVDSVDSVTPGDRRDELEQKLARLMDGLNRQFMNQAWVETTLDGQLAARTVVTWGGDIQTYLRPGLPAEWTTAHWQALDQALAARRTSLRAILTVTQMAEKIVLAVTTPLGASQALALAWQFTRQVVLPLLDKV